MKKAKTKKRICEAGGEDFEAGINALRTRTKLVTFEQKVSDNRQLAEDDSTKADAELLEFDRLSQSPNDASAIDFRLKILKKHVL